MYIMGSILLRNSNIATLRLIVGHFPSTLNTNLHPFPKSILSTSRFTMAVNRGVVVALVLVGLLAMLHVSEAAAKNCGKDPFAALKPCIPAITGDYPKPPSAACCSAVKKADLDCLCDAVLSFKPPKDFKPNVQAALALPKTCKRSIPKDFQCKGIKI